MSMLELTLATVAADRDGMAVAAWLGEAGVAAARAATAGSARWVGWAPVMQQLMLRRAEVMQAREDLARVGSNLNQLVRLAHIQRAHTGSIGTQLVDPGPVVDTGPAADGADMVGVLKRVERAVARVDTAVAGIDGLIAGARDELLRDGQR